MNEYQELIATHQELQKRLSDQPVTLDVDEVHSFIKKVREAGARIRDGRQREQLRAILRSWGAFVFERAGYYPETQLASYDGPIGLSDLPLSTQANWVLWLVGLALVIVIIVVAFIVARQSRLRAVSVTPVSSTEVATPAPLIVMATVKTENAALHSDASLSSSVIGLLPSGSKLILIARSRDNAWLKVEAGDRTVGWISLDGVDFDRARLAQIQVAVAQTVPTPQSQQPTPVVTSTVGVQSVPSPVSQPLTLYIVQVQDAPPVRAAGGLNIRGARDINLQPIDTARIGDLLVVYERVQEAEGTIWLRVRSLRGKQAQGWVREQDGENMLVVAAESAGPTPTANLAPTPSATPSPTLTPVPQPSVTPTPSSTPTQTPVAALRPTPAALAVNVLAQVTPPEGVKLKVRDKPSITGAVLGELDKDAQVAILEGPTKADGLVWWRVDNGKGLIGWSAEGVGDAKYLAPAGWAR